MILTKHGENSNSSRYLYSLMLVALSGFIYFYFNIGQRILAEINNAYSSLFIFLCIIIFTFIVENVQISYKGFNAVSSVLAAVVITLWYGPYTAAFLIAGISVFRINNSLATVKGFEFWKIISRFSINFLMYTIPAQIMYQVYPFYARILLYLFLALVVNQILMGFYFPLFLLKPFLGVQKSLACFAMEYFPVIILTPLTQVIHDLQLSGYRNIFLLYYIYPLFLIVFVLITRILNASSRVNNEREKLQHFQKALKGILSGLKLVRSTEDSGVILQKATKLLTELLGYKEALISVIHRDDKRIERIGHYGIDQDEFDRLQSEEITLDVFNTVFDSQFDFAGTYFVPAESGVFKKISNESDTEGKKYKGKDDESWRDDDLFLVPLLNSEGMIIGYISLDSPVNGKRPSEEDAEIARIFTEQIGRMLETSVKYKEIVETTQIDRMTKLCNHTYFYERADELIKRSDFVKPLSFLMMDIDDFKTFNDKYGHLTGDNVLISVARIIRHNVPQNSVVARYGGEEFAILLPDTAKLKAVEYANKLLKEIRSTKIDGLSVTLSCGVSTFPEDGRFSSTLVSAADSALYISKKTGKDKVTMV